MVTVDPRAFSLHKFWLSSVPTRDPLKKRRDRLQALAVKQLVDAELGFPWDTAILRQFPERICQAFFASTGFQRPSGGPSGPS